VLTATAHEARSREELQAATGIIDREHFRKAYIESLVTAGWLESTIPDKPTSHVQKHRLDGKGGDWLAVAAASGLK
jgi:ATP-dependent DNA helicase RecG